MSWHIGIPPGIRNLFGKKNNAPQDLWVKDPTTGRLEFRPQMEENLFVMPESGYHMPMPVAARLQSIFDNGAWENIPTPETPPDPLRFSLKTLDGKRYSEKLKDAYKKTGAHSAVVVSVGTLEGLAVTLALHNFLFVGGTLARAEGEAVMSAFKVALKRRTPLILFTASGGARMQEGIFSLMQMARTTIAVQEMREARLPYVVVLTNPTYGGVTASYAMLGDILIAEPGAMIGFAGQKVTIEVARERNFPPGYQTAEFQLDKGALDMIVRRHELRATLSRVCRLLMKVPAFEHKVAA